MRKNVRIIENHIGDVGDLPLTELRSGHLQGIMTRLQTEGLGYYGQLNVYKALSQMTNLAWNLQQIERPWMRSVDRPKKRATFDPADWMDERISIAQLILLTLIDPHPSALPVIDRRGTLSMLHLDPKRGEIPDYSHLQEPRRAAVEAALSLVGLRAGEALGLTWDNVRGLGHDEGIDLDIRQQLARHDPKAEDGQRGYYIKRQTKTKQRRIVPLNAPYARALMHWMTKHANGASISDAWLSVVPDRTLVRRCWHYASLEESYTSGCQRDRWRPR